MPIRNFMFRSMSAMSNALKIGTHSGGFHCDEALACYMLRKLPEYKDAKIIRTRDDKVIETCDIVVDVGGIYDHSKKRYDHHQRTFTETMSSLRSNFDSKIRLSSAGLVYHHYGEQVIQIMLQKQLDPIMLDSVFRFVYEHLIREIDAVDNGIPMHETGEPQYKFNTCISSRVSRLLPPWNEPDVDEAGWSQLFEKAVELVGTEFDYVVSRFLSHYWPSREIVKEAIDKRFTTDPSGAIIELPSICPWMEHFFRLEKEQGIVGSVKYAIYKDGAVYRTRAVPLTPGNYVLRAAIHPKWQGLRDQELVQASGIEGAIFVHANGFIGGAKTREGALALALKTLELGGEQKLS